jgi:hypothetical protein
MAWHGIARKVKAWHVNEWNGKERHGMERKDMVWNGMDVV